MHTARERFDQEIAALLALPPVRQRELLDERLNADTHPPLLLPWTREHSGQRPKGPTGSGQPWLAAR
jgi:hypothetical protein